MIGRMGAVPTGALEANIGEGRRKCVRNVLKKPMLGYWYVGAGVGRIVGAVEEYVMVEGKAKGSGRAGKGVIISSLSVLLFEG